MSELISISVKHLSNKTYQIQIEKTATVLNLKE
jgi:hypothetical protein